jgi:hypothetical protein
MAESWSDTDKRFTEAIRLLERAARHSMNGAVAQAMRCVDEAGSLMLEVYQSLERRPKRSRPPKE